MKAKVIGYWASTILLALALVSGGAAQLLRRRENIEGILHLGYPVYFIVILGFWKVLGGIAVLVPRFPRLKEWAYAGIFIEMTGASASHAASGDSIGHFIAPLVFAVLAIASWALRPQDRILGVLFS
jgi:uncharacterized membrane protein YphA (DoxX/SURF4 family)